MITITRLSIDLLLFGVALTWAQQTSPDGCFQVWQNSKVKCLTPFDQRTGLSEQQCRDACVQTSGCQAVQYISSTRTCQLYQKAAARRLNKRQDDSVQTRHGGGGCHSGGNSHAHGGPGASGHKSPPGGRGGPPQPPPRGPPHPPPRGPGGPPPGRGRRKRGGGGGRGSGSHGRGHGCGGGGGGGTCQPGLESASGYTYYKNTGQCYGGVTTQGPSLPPGATCPSGQVVRYYIVEGSQLSGTPDATFTASSEQACIDACTNNRSPDGRQVPCRSFDYDAQASKCSLSFQPTGIPQVVTNDQLKHYEKVCVDATFGGRCPGPYFKGPQKILIGYAQAVANAGSADDCLRLCSDSQARYGFSCQSVMFYSQETTNNCILNSETRGNHPDLYVPETGDTVDYYELGCSLRVLRATRQLGTRNRNVLVPNSPNYSGWTMCDHQIRDHKRYRLCKGMNPNKCQTDKAQCDPAKEDEYDLDTANQLSTSDPISSFSPIIDVTIGPIDLSTDWSAFTVTEIQENKESGRSTTASINNDWCQPTIKPDGKKDCENGMRRGKDGRHEKCKPLKKDC